MRRVLQSNLAVEQQRGSKRTSNITAPVAGWNTRDSLVDMDEDYAPVLDNFFPRQGQCELRGGSASFATGMTGDVKTLIHYRPTTGAAKMLASTNSGIYDITAGGAIGAVVKAMTEGYLSYVLLTNSAGTTWLWIANGVDKVVIYDGTTWTSIDGASTPAITGVTTTNLIYPWLFKHRIWCLEKGTMNAWYLSIDSIAGAAVQFPMGNLFKRGGALYSGTSWTLDAGDGPDDLLAVITDQGEVAVYRGTDPQSASSFSLVGVWYVGVPLGRKCFFRVGGDVGLMTVNGVFLLSKILSSGGINYLTAITNKIQPTFSLITKSLPATLQGWQGQVFPVFDAVLVNIPTASTQVVINTVTGALCSFSGWNALCFDNFNSSVLYFGTVGGVVKKAWDGSLTADDSSDVVTTVQQAYSYLGSKTDLKVVDVLRPLLAYDAAVQISVGLSSDYQEASATSVYSRGTQVAGSPWNTSPWNTSPWATALIRYKNWMSAFHPPGYAISLLLQTASNNSKLTWSGTDYVYTGGGVM